jgi:hypothetical protein
MTIFRVAHILNNDYVRKQGATGSPCENSLRRLQIRKPGKNLPMPPANQCIKKTLELAELMLKLADEGDATRKDVGCGVLYGVLRDSAYRIKKLAEVEREAHIKKGAWVK